MTKKQLIMAKTKPVHLLPAVHKAAKKYCLENNLLIGGWISGVINKELIQLSNEKNRN